MSQPIRFADVVDAVDQLSRDEQEEIVSILRRRWAAKDRRRLIKDVKAAQREFAAGKCRAVSVDELMREIRQ